jgi:hypothetical protein
MGKMCIVPYKIPAVRVVIFWLGFYHSPNSKHRLESSKRCLECQDVCYGTDVPLCCHCRSGNVKNPVLAYSDEYEDCFYFCGYAAIRKPPAALVDAYFAVVRVMLQSQETKDTSWLK